MKKYKSKISKVLTALLIMTQTVTAFGALPTIDSITATHPDYVDFVAHPSITAEEFNTYDITMYYPVLTLDANYGGYTYSVSADGTVYASGVSDNENIALSIPTRNYTVTLSKNNYDTVTQSVNVYNDVTINPKLIDTITFIVNKGSGSYKIVNPALGADWYLSGTSTDGVINKIVVPTKGNYELIYTPDDVRKSKASYKFYVEGNYYSYLDTTNGYDKLVDGLQDVGNKPPSIEQGAYKKYIVLETQYVGLEEKFGPSYYTYDYVIEGLNTSQPYYKSGTTTSARTEIPVLEQGTYRVTINKEGYAMKRITDTGVEFYDSIDFVVGPNDPNEEVQYTNVYTPIYADLREPSPITTDDKASKHIVTLKTQYVGKESTTKPELYTFDYIITSDEKIYSEDGIPTNIVAKGRTTTTTTDVEVPKVGNYTLEIIKTGFAMRKYEGDKVVYYNSVDFSVTSDGVNKTSHTEVPVNIYQKVDIPNKPIEVEQGAPESWVTFETQYANTGTQFSPDLYEFDYIIYNADVNDPTVPTSIVERGRTSGPNFSVKMSQTGNYVLEVVKEGFAMRRTTEQGLEYYNTIPFTISESKELVNYTKVPVGIYKKVISPKPPVVEEGAFVRNITLHSQYENYVGTVDSNLYTYKYEIYYNNDSIHGNELATSGTNASVTKQITLPSTGNYKLVIIKDGFGLQRTTNGKIEYYNEIPFTIEESKDKVTNLDIQVPLYKKVDLIEKPTVKPPVENTLQKVIISLSSNVKGYNLFVRQADGSYPYKTVVTNTSGFDVKLPQMGDWIFDVSKYGYYPISNLTVNAQAGSTPVKITLNRLSLGDLIDLIGGEIETGVIDNSGNGLVDNIADKVEDLINEGLLDLEDAQDFVDGLLDDSYIVEDVYNDLVDELIDREILNPKAPTEVPTGGGGGGGYTSSDDNEDTSSTVDIGKPEVVPPTVTTDEDDSEFNAIAEDAIDKYKDGELSDQEYMALLTKAIASKYNYTKAENTIGETDFYITDDDGVEITTLDIPTYVEARDQSTRIAVTDMFGVEGTDFIWNAADKTCSVEFNGKVFLVLYMNSSKITLNGVEGRMVNGLGQEIIIDNQSGKLTIPIRFFSEKIGFNVGWNGEFRRVTLEAPDETKVDTNLSK